MHNRENIKKLLPIFFFYKIFPMEREKKRNLLKKELKNCFNHKK